MGSLSDAIALYNAGTTEENDAYRQKVIKTIEDLKMVPERTLEGAY